MLSCSAMPSSWERPMTPVTELKFANGKCAKAIGDWSAETAKTAETFDATKWCSNSKRLVGGRRTGFWPTQTAQTAETSRVRSLLIGISLAEIAEIRRAFAWRMSGGRRKRPAERAERAETSREAENTGFSAMSRPDGNWRKPAETPADLRRSLNQ